MSKRFFKIIFFMSSIMAFLTTSSVSIWSSSMMKKNILPVLPEKSIVHGGHITIPADGYTIPDGLILGSKFNVVGSNAGNYGFEIFNNGKCQLDIVFGDHVHKSINSNPKLYADIENDHVEPIILTSANSRYLPKLNMVCFVDEKDMLCFYNLEKSKIVYKRDNFEITKILEVSKDKILFSAIGSYELFDTVTWHKILTCDERYSWDKKTFVSSNAIVDLTGSNKIIDISKIDLGFMTNFDRDVIYTIGYLDERKINLVRFSRTGVLLSSFDVELPYDLQNGLSASDYELRDNLMLIPVKWKPETKYVVIDIFTGKLKWEKDYGYKTDVYCTFCGNNLIEKTSNGLVVYDLESFEIVKTIPLSADARFLSYGSDRYVVGSGFDENHKTYKAVYKLDDENCPVPESVTRLPEDSTNIYPVGDGFWVAKFKTVSDNNHRTLSNEYYFEFHKLSSMEPGRALKLSFDEKQNFLPYNCVSGDRFYVFRTDCIEVYSLSRGKVIGKMELGIDEDHEAASDFYQRGKHLYVHLRSNFMSGNTSPKNVIYCFNKDTFELLFRQELSKYTRVKQVEQDYVLLEVAKGEVDYSVLRTDGRHILLAGAYAISGNTLYYKKSLGAPSTGQDYLCKRNLVDDTEECFKHNEDTVEPDFIGYDFFYSHRLGFLSDMGEKIQDSIGCWNNFVNSKSGCHALFSEFYNQYNSAPLIRGNNIISMLNPCPTFSIKRRSRHQFELVMTRKDGLSPNLSGVAYAVCWGDNGGKPLFVDLAKVSKQQIVDLKSGETIVLNFKNEDIANTFGNSFKYIAVIIESNGLLDTANSELSDFDKEGRPLFDGIPIGTQTQQSVVITLWKY